MDINQLADSSYNNAALDFHGKQANIWTSIPGVITEFFPLTQTASVRPAIQIKQFESQINNLAPIVTNTDLPILLDCPVQFPSGGGTTLTFPVNIGDECLIVFASRCIDSWWYQGLVPNGSNDFYPVPQATMRMHDLSDGFVVLGFKSAPNVIPNISITSVQLRSNDGKATISITPSTLEIDIVSTSAITMTAPAVFITGAFYVNGDTVFDGSLTANGHIIDQTHTHGSVTTGTGTSGPVT